MAVDVKEAIGRAKTYLSMVFAEEDVSDVRLEEVVHDRGAGAWLITFGLIRPSSRGIGVADLFATAMPTRSYKVVRVPDDPDDTPSIRIRELAED